MAITRGIRPRDCEGNNSKTRKIYRHFSLFLTIKNAYSDVPMTILAHISDLHFGREHPQLVEGLLQSLDEIQPKLVVISGDLTQRARAGEFRAARTFLDRLRWPFLVISGNHDIPTYNLAERFINPWKKWRRYLDLPLEPTMQNESYIAIGINSTRRLSSLIDWSRGRINDTQVRAVADYFDAEADQRKKLRLLVIHHPFWLPKIYHRRHAIAGRDMAFTVMKKAGVDIVLGGHIHIAYTRVLEGIIISHAGTAISNRLLADSRNSFKIIRGDRKNLTVETWEWSSMRFGITDNQYFRRIQGRWIEKVKEL
jgi:predicted MPP superfamily phosphohydrolase